MSKITYRKPVWRKLLVSENKMQFLKHYLFNNKGSGKSLSCTIGQLACKPFNDEDPNIELYYQSLWIDNHSSGMAVQHCVRAYYLGPHCILAQKQYCQKLMAQLNSTALITSVCAIWSYKTVPEKFCDCCVKIHYTHVLFWLTKYGSK